MKTYSDLGILIPEVYLPKPGIDLYKWAVIAVDQFTSQPEYWEQVEKIVGDAPSTFHLTLPEIYLEQPGEAERIQRIQATMRQYLDAGILQPREGLIYVERTAGGKTRKGLMLCLDLECLRLHQRFHQPHPRHRRHDRRTPAAAHENPRRRGAGTAAHPGADR